jgi:hypothetical protein
MHNRFNCTGPVGDEELGEQLPKMSARVAETLVRKWQHIKSQAFGPDHCLGRLQEVRNLVGPLKWRWELLITLFQNLV